MLKNLVLVTVLLSLLVVGFTLYTANKKALNDPKPQTIPSIAVNPTLTITPSMSVTPVSSIQPSINQYKSLRIKIAAIQTDTKGPIGCGDTVQMINRDIPYTTGTLRAAITELLSIKSQYLGESKLYNALYQSNLKVSELKLKNSTADIYLGGSFSIGGVCDAPRVKAQLRQTALQFSTVKEARFYINGKTLDSVLSEK